MMATLINYALLAIAAFAPVVAFGLVPSPALILSLTSFFSLGALVYVAFDLARVENQEVGESLRWHRRNQKYVLLLLAIGGIATTLRTFAYYEQFQLRFGAEVPIVAAIFLVWILVVGLLGYGMVTLLARSEARSG